jgi:hypothetical protein
VPLDPREIQTKDSALYDVDVEVPHAISRLFAQVLEDVVGQAHVRVSIDLLEVTSALFMGLGMQPEVREVRLDKMQRTVKRSDNSPVHCCPVWSCPGPSDETLSECAVACRLGKVQGAVCHGLGA